MYILTVDCVWNDWGNWTACSKECGGGQQSRTKTIRIAAANGGEQCEGEATEEQACNTDNCTVL